MKIEIILNKQDIERLNRLTQEYNSSPSKLIKSWILNATNELEGQKAPTQDYDSLYDGSPFGDDDLEDMDDWDFNWLKSTYLVVGALFF